MTSPAPSTRLSYIDWMRGVACLLMIQIHGYDSWLMPEARRTEFFAWARVLGGFAAPSFLFLAGVSTAFVTDKLHLRGLRPAQIANVIFRRGAFIFGLGLLLRLQEFILSWGRSPLEQLFRVDVLNVIGLTMMLTALIFWAVMGVGPTNPRVILTWTFIVSGMALSLLAPPLWTTWRPRWLPWYLESYINGVHNLDQPQSWLFPIFPWGAFTFMGMACGLIFASASARRHQVRTIILSAAVGGGVVIAARYVDAHGPALYAVYDFWRTSPNYFLVRLGILLMFLPVAYGWCRWVVRARPSSPLVLLGQHSLLVYWVHLLFVYGGLTIIERRTATIEKASYGVLALFLGMYVLVRVWSELKNRGAHRPILGKAHPGSRDTLGPVAHP